jgi:TonB family protein
MRPFVITALLLAVSTAFGAQNKTKPEGEYDVKRCRPKVVSRRGGKSPEFHFRKGETYRNSPVVAYEILESGEITHIVLKRSSGVAEVDDYALKCVQELKFNKRPGCGVIESNLDITVDFR